MAEIEREVKLTLPAKDYRRILDAGRVLGCRDQLNVYLHDPDRLQEGTGYFRVRFESGREPRATLKVPLGWEGAVREMVEVERPLTDMGPGLFPRPRRVIHVDRDLPGEMAEHFLALGLRRLRRLGWMRNLRCRVEVEGSGVVELDRTVLPGGRVHYEVEIETPERELLLRLLAWVKETVPSAELSTVGKFTRFVDAMRKSRAGLPGY